MRLTALAALIACPFVACYCTLSVAEGAETEKVAASCIKSHVSTYRSYERVAAPKGTELAKATGR